MKKTGLFVAASAALLVGGCSSDTEIQIDETLANKIDVMEDCFSELYKKLDAVLEAAKLWNYNTSTNPPDPTGLSSAINSAELDVTYNLPSSSCVMTMNMKFFEQAGTQITPNFTSPESGTSVSVRLDNAATDMRNRFPNTKPFIVGKWNFTGSTGATTNRTVTGGGVLTGRIGGASNQNELERVRTTTDQVSGGEPPNADNSITLTNASDNTDICTLTFNTDDLQTDTVANQQYPIGTITIRVNAQNTAALKKKGVTTEVVVNATMTFDNTNIAKITVEGLTGRFEINLDDFSFSYKT